MSDLLDAADDKSSEQPYRVSVRKQCVRLLFEMPAGVGLPVTLREWKRPFTHRDVRITILKVYIFVYWKINCFSTNFF